MKALVLVLVIQTVFLAGCIHEKDNPQNEDYVKVGDMVPRFEVGESAVAANGAAFESPDFFVGKRSLLIFFTTWCPYCRNELPFVEYASQQLSDLNVIAISREEVHSKVTEYWEDHGFTMPAYLDPDRSIFDKFAPASVPRAYMIGEDGKIVWMSVGSFGYGEFTEAGGGEFLKLIKKQLNI